MRLSNLLSLLAGLLVIVLLVAAWNLTAGILLAAVFLLGGAFLVWRRHRIELKARSGTDIYYMASRKREEPKPIPPEEAERAPGQAGVARPSPAPAPPSPQAPETEEDSALAAPEPQETEEEEMPVWLGGLPDEPAPAASNVQFKLYVPGAVSVERRYGLVLYAYRAALESIIDQDAQNFRADFGPAPPRQRTARQTVSIRQETPITVVPESDEVTFEPARLTKTWDGEWLRFPFDFRVPPDTEEVWIRVSIRIAGLEVAHVKASCHVVAENPLAQAVARGDLTAHITAPYRDVFISYSHDDQTVALARARMIEEALGDRVFIDVKSLRAGDDWQYRLGQAIQQADIFHLLWSENAAQSKWCRYEWDFALNHKCAANRCVGVIRPVYWQEPMPPPPAELGHLHFEFVEFEPDKQAE